MKIQISRKTETERKLYLSARYRGQRTRRKLRTWKKACSPLYWVWKKKREEKGEGKAGLGACPGRDSEDT